MVETQKCYGKIKKLFYNKNLVKVKTLPKRNINTANVSFRLIWCKIDLYGVSIL